METGLDGIALSCDKKTLYYTPLTSRTLYAISTKYLKNGPSDVSKNVVELGYKLSASDGLMCSQNGKLYLTAIELNSVLLQTDITPNVENFQFNVFSYIMQNSTSLMWPDTLGFNDSEKTLYAMSNQLQNFVQGRVDFMNPIHGNANFHIWKIYVNDKSYLNDCNFSSPNDDEDSFPIWAIILVVIVVLVVLFIAGCAIRNYIQSKKKRQTFI